MAAKAKTTSVAYDGTQFGRWVRQHRKAHDLTQRALAREIGCSESTLRKIEAGTRRPSRQIVERLAEFFDVAAGEQQEVMKWARLGTGASISQIEPAAGAMAQGAERTDGEDGTTRLIHNLPSRLTRLIGREGELAEVSGYLRQAGARLLTLTGPPGVGKTRLAIEAARGLLPDYGDGVFLIELTLVRDPQLVLAFISQALGLKQPGDEDALSGLSQALRDKQMLLVLDNFEQVAPAAPAVVRLLEACPQLKVLVTSREALHVHGEQQFTVPPLAVPTIHERRRIDDAVAIVHPSQAQDSTFAGSEPVVHLMQYASVRLFVERASTVKPTFRLAAENASAVAAICARLDGLPLAIELAAGQVKMLSPATMLTRLNNRLALLSGGARDLPVRHQTLRDAISWSYDLLSQHEQALFARLSVFAGGCTLAAIEDVCEGLPSTFGLLKSLLDKSLLQQREAPNAEPRFHMLETIREHATERLEESGDAGEVRARHAQYYLAFAEDVEPKLTGQDQETWLNTLEEEHDNMRIALGWATSRSEYELAARIAGALLRFWDVRGYWSEGRRWLESALVPSAGAGRALPARVRARAALGAGRLAYLQDENVRSQSFFDESLRFFRDAEDTAGVAEALSGLAYLAARRGERDVAGRLLEESLTLSRELGDRRSVARTLGNMGSLAIEAGDYPRAATMEREALSLFRELHDRRGMAATLADLGQLAAEQADYGLAVSLLEESLALSREVDDKGHVAWVLGDLGIATLAAGEYRRSKAATEEALQLMLDLGDKRGRGMALFTRGVGLADEGYHERARSCFQESLETCLEIGDKGGYALGIEGLAYVAMAMNDLPRSARLAGMAEMLRGEEGYRVELIEHPLHERTLTAISAVMDERDLQQMLSEGRNTSAEQAVTYALQKISPS